MKKLLATLFSALILLCSVASAEELATASISVELPSAVKYHGSASFFSLSDEDELYAVIEDGLINHSDSIDVSKFRIQSDEGTANSRAKFTMEEAVDIFCSAVYNHPELGDLLTEFGYTYYSNGELSGLVAALEPVYNSEYNETAFEYEINYILSKTIAPEMSDIDKLLSLHDYLTDTITYAAPSMTSYTSYGAIVNRVAVCQGYSLAFKLLCDRAGLDCGYAVSTAENHMWNIVGLDGNYYHIDVTHDDPTGTYVNNILCKVDRTLHRHFLTSDDEAVVLRGYNGYNWTSDRLACTDSDLHSSLACSSVTDPIIWRGGSFWYKEYGFYLSGNEIVYIPTGKLYKYQNGSFARVSKSDYLPDNMPDCKMFNLFNGKLAIDGISNLSADLYLTAFDADNRLSAVVKGDITFGNSGRALINIGGKPSKIMLFSDGGQIPLAYAAE